MLRLNLSTTPQVQDLPLHFMDQTLLLPVVVEHTVDERSPLYGKMLMGGGDGPRGLAVAGLVQEFFFQRAFKGQRMEMKAWQQVVGRGREKQLLR
jgi:hypothetical protein